MKIRTVSDLHFEFHADAGETLASEVTSTGERDFDVLVVAGDLTSSRLLPHSVSLLCGKTKKPIVYVTGNHEFYGSNRENVVKTLRGMERLFPHFHYLDHEIFELDGVRFLGTPLWFRKSKAPTWEMNDFSAIEKFGSWVYAENGRSREFLHDELEDLDVVVTHYLPAERSIHKDYKGSVLNPFFLCDMEGLIKTRRPQLWIHGHTHRSCDYEIHSDGGFSVPAPTRVVCNPYGYVAIEENLEFDPMLTVEASNG